MCYSYQKMRTIFILLLSSETNPRVRHVFDMCSTCVTNMCSTIFILLLSSQTTMSKKTGKRKRGEGPMIEGDIDLAMAVMPETIYITKKDGTTVAKQIWVSLDTPPPKANITAVDNPPEMPIFNDPVDMSSPPPETARKYRVSFHRKLSDVHF